MTSKAKFLASIGIVLVVASSARAESWRSYHNDRFGVTADVPADWKMEPPPANDDGRDFTSPDGRATITVSGIFAINGAEEELASRLEPGQGETITYKKRRSDWIVVSGTKGDRIFYRKTLLSCGDVANDLSIEYPAAEKQKYDALVAHAAASLKPGSGLYYGRNCRRRDR
jgi:hypothetical protein